jgi:hypothetical protein
MISPQVSVYSVLYILGLYGDRAALMISPQVSVYSDLYILGLYGACGDIIRAARSPYSPSMYKSE